MSSCKRIAIFTFFAVTLASVSVYGGGAPSDEYCIVGGTITWKSDIPTEAKRATLSKLTVSVWREFDGDVEQIRTHGLDEFYLAIPNSCDEANARWFEVLRFVTVEIGSAIEILVIEGPVEEGPSTIEL